MNKEIQRYIDVMKFRKTDKVPLAPSGPRESTLAAWHEQGLPKDVDYIDALIKEIGIDEKAILRCCNVGTSFRMIPEYEPKILEHKNGHYIVRDWMGAITEISDYYDPSYLYNAKDFVTRKWHKFPVETRADWEEMKLRFDPNSEGRINKESIEKCIKLREDGYVPMMNFNGIFWQLREWCGFENLCIMMAEQPEFVHEMAEYWTDFVSVILDKLLLEITPDRVLISEDMAYKSHSMISPKMTREFILPAYRIWVKKLKDSGCQVIEVDSDGFIEELVPLWIETGIDSCSPIEVAAGNDIVRFREIFKNDMAYMQGVDKRLIAKGGKVLEDHLMRIIPPLIKEGGYIPGCDHGVPSDISWQNFIEYSRVLAKLCGWL